MGLQWSLDLRKTLMLLNNYLTHNGLLIFSIPLEGTFSELRYRNPFYQQHNIARILKKSGFNLVSTQYHVYTEEFSRQLDAIQSIKAAGANCSMIRIQEGLGLMSLHKFQDLFLSGHEITLTYKIGIFLAKKRGK